jgi:hypothetical protein
VFAVVAVVLLALLTLGQPLRLATSRKHQAFAELSFTDATRSTSTRDGKASMSFTIRNAEGRPTAYTYVVTVNGLVRRKGTTPVVPESGHYDVTVTGLVLPAAPERARLEVSLNGGPAIRTWASR